MEITDYTSYREVRTACGLTEHDISDAMLGDPLFSNELYLQLDEVELPETDPGPGNLIDRFAEIEAAVDITRTAKEKKLVILTKLLATYIVAGVVCKSISLTAAKSRSDGKTVDTRFSTDLALTLTPSSVYSAIAKYKRAIENINDTMVTDYSLLTVVSPETDVVTNE